MHVWNAHTSRKRSGLQSSVLNIDTRAPASDAYIRISGGVDLIRQLLRHTANDWELNVHTNGHNRKSWLISLICGVAAQLGPGATLTLHSGLAPAYLQTGRLKRLAAAAACRLYDRVVCVNEQIAAAIASLGIPLTQLQIKPAFFEVDVPEVTLPAEIESWLEAHSPIVTATMFFRPEYGFDVLEQGIAILREEYPHIGCLVMGAGDRPAHGLGDTLLLAGDADHERCLAVMARSSVFVRPTYTDGDSISVREALSLGVPVVASNVGTRPEGTMLFEAGDVEGMVEQVRRILAAKQLPS